jgi:hypothetical protein
LQAAAAVTPQIHRSG